MARTTAALHSRKTLAAVTLVELLVGLTITSVLMAGVGMISITLQRSFVAADYQMTAQNDQLRVLDYIGRDLRMTSTLTILNGGAKLSLTVPSASSSSAGTISLTLAPPLNTLLVPAASGTTTAATMTVAYYVEGGQLIREVNGVQTVLASTVSELSFVHQDPFVTTSVLFTPQFSLDPTIAAQQVTRATGSTFLLNMASGN